MTAKYYVTAAGAYVGSFDGMLPPAGSIEVPEAPEDARQIWNGTAWGPRPARLGSDSRIDAYLAVMGKGEAPIFNMIVGVLEILTLELVARGTSATPAFTQLVNRMAAIRAANPGA